MVKKNQNNGALSAINKLAKKVEKLGLSKKSQPKQRSRMGKGSGIKGRGNYAAMAAAGAAARALGNKLIAPGTFEKTGASIGRGLSGVLGFGDYVVNDTFSGKGKPQPQVISNCEFAFDFKKTGIGFTPSEYDINPANSALFPWLSRIASLYTNYRFRQLVFEFRTMCSDYSSTMTLGSIIMAPQYNVDLSAFSTKQQMEAATHAVSFKPSCSALCGFECDSSDMQVRWYTVRNSITDATTKFTDPGTFTIAASGLSNNIADGSVVGEVWVRYTVELIDPILAYDNTSVTANPGYSLTYVDNATAGKFQQLGGYDSGTINTIDLPTSGITPGFQKNLAKISVDPTSQSSYWVAIDTRLDTTDAYSPASMWFRVPGVYIVDLAMAFASATPPQTYTAAPSGSIFSPAITKGAGAVTWSLNLPWSSYTGASAGVTMKTIIRVNEMNTRVTFYLGAGWRAANNSTAVMQRSWLSICSY